MASRGMIQLAGRTYRLVEISRATYRAVRISDETELGVFRCGSPLQLWGGAATMAELRAVARSAIRAGKTKWHHGADLSATLRTYAMFSVGMMLGLASCSGSPRSVAAPPGTTAPNAAVHGPTPAPAATDAARDLSGEARQMPDMPPRAASLDRVMHAHFHDALLIRKAVIAGRPEQATAPARILAVLENDQPLPESWQEHAERMQTAARRVAAATSMEQAAAATADLAVSCGECHRKLGGPGKSYEPPPANGTTVAAWMKRHLWASERLWQGLVVPSTEAWSAGTQVMASSAVPEQLLANEGTQGRRAAAELARLVAKAPQLVSDDARAGLYADLLLTCGACHRAVKLRRTD